MAFMQSSGLIEWWHTPVVLTCLAFHGHDSMEKGLSCTERKTGLTWLGTALMDLFKLLEVEVRDSVVIEPAWPLFF